MAGSDVLPIKRSLRFNLPDDRVNDWNKQGLHVTAFLNALSMFFPAGESFFIRSVARHREELSAAHPTDAKLGEQVKAFVGQEAVHSREHEEYNEVMARAGYPVARTDAAVAALLALVERLLPKRACLAATVALEHLTASMGEVLLANVHLLGGAEEHYAALWRWHALEEVEHKAVAFDVYEAVYGTGGAAYVRRVGACGRRVVVAVMMW
jgi:predicted metal-dependent hydrolase